MNKTTTMTRVTRGVLVLACGLHGINGVADTTGRDAPTISRDEGAADRVPRVNHSVNRLTGDESMWGVIGKPSEAILNLVNASPLMVSELIDYQDAVNSNMALPFGNLQADWSGANMLVLLGSIKQIVISSDVVAASPAETVGDLSYGLGFFRNYDDNRQLIETSIGKLSPDDPKYRIVFTLIGVTIKSRAEVNNYVIQQQIIARTGATTKQPVIIKLVNDQNAKGMLQFTLDNVNAADRAIGMPPDMTKLEQAAYGVTKLIPTPNRSAQ